MAMNSAKINANLTLSLLKDLIKIPSVNPAIEGHGEDDIARYISQWFRKTGEFNVEEQRVSKNRFNVIATLRGKGEGRSLMLNGHMDTVGTSGMTVRPFRPFADRGRMHGRGACDMKGSIAAMMSAMLTVARSENRPTGDIIFAAVVDEEYKSKGAWHLIKRSRTDAAIVGEPTGMNVAIAHKGYAWLEVKTIGKRAHGSVPEQGIDAIANIAPILSGLKRIRKRYALRRHRLVGTPKIHSSFINGGSDWSTVPDQCTLRLERRLLPGEHPQDAVNELRKLIGHCRGTNKSLRAKVQLIHHGDSMEVNRTSPHILMLRRIIRRLDGRGAIIGVPYWTDASILVNHGKIPACLFGPGDIQQAHSPDEYVNVSDVITSAKIYANMALEFCS